MAQVSLPEPLPSRRRRRRFGAHVCPGRAGSGAAARGRRPAVESSAALVESTLRYYFQHPGMDIEECVERRVEIDVEQQNRLGRANSQLGSSLVLGDRIRDRSGKFRIHIRDLDWEGFHDFLPGGKGYAALLTLVRFCLRTPLAHDLRLQLRRDAIHPLFLAGDNLCQLGWTSWLGESDYPPEVTLASGIKD